MLENTKYKVFTIIKPLLVRMHLNALMLNKVMQSYVINRMQQRHLLLQNQNMKNMKLMS